MNYDKIKASLEKYEHECETLQSLLNILIYEYPSVEDILDWARDRMEIVQGKIDECKYILDKGEGKDGKRD